MQREAGREVAARQGQRIQLKEGLAINNAYALFARCIGDKNAGPFTGHGHALQVAAWKGEAPCHFKGFPQLYFIEFGRVGLASCGHHVRGIAIRCDCQHASTWFIIQRHLLDEVKATIFDVDDRRRLIPLDLIASVATERHDEPATIRSGGQVRSPETTHI